MVGMTVGGWFVLHSFCSLGFVSCYDLSLKPALRSLFLAHQHDDAG